MSTKEIIRLLKRIKIDINEVETLPSGGGGFSIQDMPIDPYEFLRRAEEDYELGGTSSEFNSITNAKRAIICQMDQALASFGYPYVEFSIRKKTETLNSLGLITPRILKKIMDDRNLLEHEYKKPRKIEVEDALDLANLFIASIKPILIWFEDEFSLGNSSEQVSAFGFSKGLTFSMISQKRKVNYYVSARMNYKDEADGKWGEIIGKTIMNCRDNAFPALINLALATSRSYKKDIAIKRLFHDIGYP